MGRREGRRGGGGWGGGWGGGRGGADGGGAAADGGAPRLDGHAILVADAQPQGLEGPREARSRRIVVVVVEPASATAGDAHR